VVAGLVSAATAARAEPVLIGIGDQAQSSLVDPRFTPLGIKTVRIVLPWDVVQTDPFRLDDWVSATSTLGIEPLIAFGRSASDRCPSTPCRLPTDAQYRADFVEVHRRYPSLRLFTAWNEPNHGREPTWNQPAAAAHYTDIVAQECGECSVVAGDVLDAPGMLSYLASYKAALTTTPSVWGLHNYYDTTYFQSTGTEAFLNAVKGSVWLTESGGIVTWRSPDGRVQLPYDEARAASSLSYGLRVAAAHADRVARMYVYQWRPGPADDFDAGLVRPDGSERPALGVLRAALGGPGAVAGGSPGTAAGGAASAGARLLTPPVKPTARVTLGPVRLGRHEMIRARLSCSGVRCRGRVTLEGSGRTAQRLVNGRTMRGTLAPRRVRFDMKGGSRRTLRVHVPLAVLRRASHGRLRLRESAVPDTPGVFIPQRRFVRVAVPARWR
jgi:hypothetical protein